MLSADKNQQLTRVGPGTPMGELLRRYWMPIGGASELDDNPIKAIRLLGEDLVHTRDYSDETARVIDEEVESLITEAANRARTVIKHNLDKLELTIRAVHERLTE